MLPSRRPALLSGRWVEGLPTLCGVCRGWGRHRICSTCVERFAPAVPRCGRCGLEVAPGVMRCGACLIHPPPADAVVAAVDYAAPWDRLLGAFKFHSAIEFAPIFAALMAAALDRHAVDSASTIFLPMPLSDRRLRERGYNQAWELARRLARRVGAPADPELLLRVRDTPHQLALAPEARAANVRGAFAIEPARLAELRGRRVTLVDDVMTTGATAAEMSRVLQAAGAEHVLVCVLARTPRPSAGPG